MTINLHVRCASVAALLCLAAVALADDTVKLDGVKCVLNPKSAARADRSVDYKGGKVYFCCANCPKHFDAEKNAVAANHQLVATRQYKQTKCPLSGQDCSPDHKVMVAGVEVAFCCPKCQGAVAKATAEEQLQMVFGNKAFGLAFEKVRKD